MINVLIAGDFCDNSRVTPLIAEGKYSEMFAEVKPIIEAADYSMVNFEFPIVEGTSSPIEKCGPCLKGQKKAIDAIKYAGFKCATLANNHILDQGEANCLKTRALLEEAGIDTVGVGKNVKEADKILYINIKGKILAVINCCEHEFSIATETSAGANALNPVQQYYAIKEAREKVDYVLVVVHGGHEMFQLPSPEMKEAFRFFIDAGADAVVNHHQHCYSGYEVYNGKPIFYGIGNFLFDYPGMRGSSWNEGYMVELNFAANKVEFQLHPYEQCNNQPHVLPIKEDANKEFEKKVDSLNKIISDDAKLTREVNNYYASCSKFEKEQLNPYRGRVASKLYDIGILPDLIGRRKALELLNHIECESHRRKMLYALRNGKK